MMKRFQLACAGMLAMTAGAAQAATTITYSAGSGTVASDATIFQNFDALTPNQSIGTNAYVYAASTPGGVRPAFGSSGNFAAVATGGSYSVTFGPSSVFSFVLGSLDTYNALTLRYADGTTFLYNGGAIVNDPSFDSGNRTSDETNGVVTYRVTSGALLTGATFTSSGNSFEFDNLAAATAVPEPAAWAMMILGVGAVGASLRRRREGSGRIAFAA